MKVLVLSHLYPRPGDPGQATFIRRQVQELSKLGIEYRILSPVPWAPPMPAWSARTRKTLAASRATPESWELDGIRIDAPRYLKLPGALDFGLFGPLYYRGIRKLVRAIYREWKFDLIHGQMLVPDGYAAARLGQELGVPAIATERGYANRCPASGRLHSRYAQTISSLDAIVTVSRALAARVEELGTPRQPVRVVYTGVDQNAFAPGDRGAARAKLGLPDRPLVLCMARVESIKQPYLVLAAFMEAAKRRSQPVLAWVGDGAEKAGLAEAVKAAGLAERVLLPGPAKHEDVPTWLAAADVVVLGSSSEGLPNSLVEAAACARPIVATNVGGIPEVVADGQTGLLVPKGDVGALAAAIGRLLDDPGLARQMGERGRELVLGRFSWKKHGEEMVDVYRAVLAEREPN